jgi:hypothetical protein
MQGAGEIERPLEQIHIERKRNVLLNFVTNLNTVLRAPVPFGDRL